MVFVTPGDELAGLHHVRYDGVPLLDRPDDVLGRMMVELDAGDEVEVVGGAEIWTHVRTPNNLVGWVPSMTLVAVSAAPAEEFPNHLSRSTSIPPPDAEEPIALEALFEAIAAQRMALRVPQPAVEAPRRHLAGGRERPRRRPRADTDAATPRSEGEARRGTLGVPSHEVVSSPVRSVSCTEPV